MTWLNLSLWPEGTRRPLLRLAVALICAPLVLAAGMTVIAYVIAISAATSRAGMIESTVAAATAFFLYLPLLSLTAGLAGVLVLGYLGWRTKLAWAVSGALLGAALSAGLGALGTRGLVTTHVIVFTVLGMVLFALIRRFAGVRED